MLFTKLQAMAKIEQGLGRKATVLVVNISHTHGMRFSGSDM